MKNIGYKMHLILPEHPIDPVTIKVLQQVDKVSQGLGIKYFVVGATARDLVLTHVFGMPVRRVTTDLDFAISVNDWSQFELIKNCLIQQQGFSASSEMRQRLYFATNTSALGVPLDLVPFGGIENPANTVAWPPDLEIMMNVTGYSDVYAASVGIQIAPDLVIRVASLAGLVIMKLFAWKERGRSNPKDAQDIYSILQSYANAGNCDRIYDQDPDLLGSVEYNPDLAGAKLLGRDVIQISNKETQRQLIDLLKDESEMNRLLADMVGRNSYHEDAIDKADKYLSLFCQELRK